jgi:hypothetical protein
MNDRKSAIEMGGNVSRKVTPDERSFLLLLQNMGKDRDINAALNILHKWNMTSQSIVGRERAEIINACGEPRSSAKQEISISSSESFGSK